MVSNDLKTVSEIKINQDIKMDTVPSRDRPAHARTDSFGLGHELDAGTTQGSNIMFT